IDYVKKVLNKDDECVYSDSRISLDRYCLENKIKNVDFIKVDTDGADYAVLRGAEKLLREGEVLGLYVESHFHGEAHPYANTFRNIDQFLVENGFSLFDLSTWRYTKAQLPGTFLYKLPAQTVTGQISWGDALYLKDLLYMKNQGKQIPTSQIIKMACLQEIFGLPDCAAELLVAFRDQLSKVIDVDQCLNALARDMKLHPDYNTHMKCFCNHQESFFPK
ncbi:MAG: FkbM family methyltransferase, partial [Verrucomicrobia bacterium]|nr:FkbM family methyltransferase [Verrucomicrobiota bacterium]